MTKVVKHVMNPDRLLVVDDEKDVVEILGSVSANLGFCVKNAENFESFRTVRRRFDPTVVLLNLRMTGVSSIDYLKELAGQKSSVKVIISGADSRTLSTIWQLGDILGLEMAARLPRPVSMHALGRELCRLMRDSRQLTPIQLSAAIKTGKIRPHFQPRVTCDASGIWIVHEVEALARWHHSDGTMLTSNHFIGLAEDHGLILDLTDSMLNQVITQLGVWNKHGIRLRAAVNLAPSLLEDRDLPGRLERLMTKHRLDCKQLVLEVNEHIIFEHSPLAIEVLDKLRASRFGLAIDGFGSDFSSIEQLFLMPFDELKIDRSLIKRFKTSKHVRTIVEATVLLGQKLGKTVCADGVESQAAFDFLASIGCDKQQGLLIGRPVPAAEIASLLQQSENNSPPSRAIL